MDKYAVFGNPIEHSLSPDIHSQFAKQTNQSLSYEKTFVEKDTFKQAVQRFFSEGGLGLNITVPFKEEAWALSEQRSQRAQMAGAVNTLWKNEEGLICGDNTDGAGLVGDMLERLAWELEKKTILMLGAGGAARGVLLPLLEQKPRRFVIANRTEARAQDLKALFQAYGPVESSTFEELRDQNFDLIINATSASLSGELPPLPEEIVTQKSSAYDMVYSNEPTAFMAWASKQGAGAVSDGLGMLVGQAAESFSIWRGVKPEVQAVIEALRKK